MVRESENWSALLKVIRKSQPALIEDIESHFPEYRSEMSDDRVYGGVTGEIDRRSELARQLSGAALSATKIALSATFQLVESRSKLLRRIKFIGGATAALAAGGALTALVQRGAPSLVPVVSIAISLAGSISSLCATYIDEGAGGDGSIARMRETLAGHRRSIVLLEGTIALAKLTGDDAKLVEAIRELNVMAADAEFARAKLGR